MFYFVIYLRAIAVLLIMNSHFDGVYPIDISFGGALGLALFFIISGFLLININQNTSFIKWYFKKILKIYLSMYIVLAAQILIGYAHIGSFNKFARLFLWPTGYWFVSAITVLYAVYYIFIKLVFHRFGKPSLVVGSVFLSLLFALLYIRTVDLSSFNLGTNQIVLWPLWMVCMLIGIWLRKNYKIKASEHTLAYGVLSGCSMLLFLLCKVAIGYGFILKLQFLTIFFSISFAYFLFKCGVGLEEVCRDKHKSHVGKIIKIISDSSLEIYFVQFYIIQVFKNIAFPINFVLIIASTIIVSFFVHRVSDIILKTIYSKSFVKEV